MLKTVIAPEVTAEQPSLKKSERNMGVELLRIVSMLLIVGLHVLGHGGVLSATTHLSASYKLALFLNVIAYCSVNCYALISGFANIKTEFKFRRFWYLWLETVFLITATNLAVHLFVPSVTVTREWWIAGFFPLAKRELWYLCAYFFMYPLLPVLNKGLLSLKKWQHVWIIVLLQAPTWFRVLDHTDHYALNSGHSAIWLICLYVIGAYFRIYGAPKWAKWFVTLPTFLLSALLVWLYRIIPEQQVLQGILDRESELYENRKELISYLSPLVVVMSVMLLLFFMQLRIKGRIPTRVIAIFGRATWGVFVIHVTSAVWYWRDFWNLFKPIGDYPPLKLLIGVTVATCALYLALSLLSILRFYLFRFLRVHKGVDLLSDAFHRIFARQNEPPQEDPEHRFEN